MKKHILTFIMLIASLSIQAMEQQVVSLSEIQKSKHLAQKSIILEDKQSQLGIHDVLKDIPSYFNPNTRKEAFVPDSDIPYMDFTRSTFWMKLEVNNDLTESRKFNVELARPLTNHIELFVLDETGAIIYTEKTGDDFIFTKRPINYRKFIFPSLFNFISKVLFA